MESDLKLRIEQLPEGPYLAPCDAIEGLVVQAASVAEVYEIAHDVANMLPEAKTQ